MRFPFFPFGEQEHRLARFSDGDMSRVEKKLDPYVGKEAPETKELTKKEEAAEFVKHADASIANAEKNAAASDSMKAQFRKMLVEFFCAHVEVFDSNRNKSYEVSEFQKYKEAMLAKIEDLQKKFLPTKDEKEKSAKEQKKENPGEQKQEAKERVVLSGEEEIKEGEKPDPQDPEQLGKCMEKYDKNSRFLEQEINEARDEMAVVQKQVQTFDEEKKSLMSMGRGFMALFRQDPETARMRSVLEQAKTKAQENLKKLEERRAKVDTYGVAMNTATVNVRRKEEERKGKRDQEFAQQGEAMQQHREELKQAQENVLQTKVKLSEKDEQLAQQRIQLQEQQRGLQQAKQDALKKREQLQAASQQLKQGEQQVSQAADAGKIEQSKADAAKRQIQEKQDAIEQGLQKMDVSQFALAEDQVQEQVETVSEVQVQVDDQQDVLRAEEEKLPVAMEQLEQTQQEHQEAWELETVESQKVVEQIDALNVQIATSVAERTLGHEQSMESYKEQQKILSETKVEEPGVWETSPIAYLGRVLGDGISWVSNKVFDEGVFKALKWIEEQCSAIHPALGYVAKAVTMPVSVTAGLCEAAVGLVGGIGHMVASPVDAAKGLGALIGRDPKTGEWFSGDAAAEAWKASIGWEHFGKGDAGRGVGNALLNVIMTATGVGSVGTGVSVSVNAAGLGARFAQAGRLGKLAIGARSIIEHPMKFMRAAGTEYFTKVVPDTIKNISHYPKKILGIGKGAAPDVGAAVSKIEGMKLNGGKTIKDFGMNVEEVARLNPAEIDALCGARPGAKFEDLYAATKLKDAVKEFTNVRYAQEAAELKKMHPKLDGVQNLDGPELDAFMQKFNESDRFMGENMGTEGKLVKATEKGIVVFDDAGKLVHLTDPVQISAHIPSLAKALNISEDAARIMVAEKSIGRTLSKVEREAVIKAHEAGKGIGEIQTAAVDKVVDASTVTKGKILYEAMVKERIARGMDKKLAKQLTREEVQKLMDKGVTGKTMDALPTVKLTKEIAARLNSAEFSDFFVMIDGKQRPVRGKVFRVKDGKVTLKTNTGEITARLDDVELLKKETAPTQALTETVPDMEIGQPPTKAHVDDTLAGSKVGAEKPALGKTLRKPPTQAQLHTAEKLPKSLTKGKEITILYKGKQYKATFKGIDAAGKAAFDIVVEGKPRRILTPNVSFKTLTRGQRAFQSLPEPLQRAVSKYAGWRKIGREGVLDINYTFSTEYARLSDKMKVAGGADLGSLRIQRELLEHEWAKMVLNEKQSIANWRVARGKKGAVPEQYTRTPVKGGGYEELYLYNPKTKMVESEWKVIGRQKNGDCIVLDMHTGAERLVPEAQVKILRKQKAAYEAGEVGRMPSEWKMSQAEVQAWERGLNVKEPSFWRRPLFGRGTPKGPKGESVGLWQRGKEAVKGRWQAAVDEASISWHSRGGLVRGPTRFLYETTLVPLGKTFEGLTNLFISRPRAWANAKWNVRVEARAAARIQRLEARLEKMRARGNKSPRLEKYEAYVKAERAKYDAQKLAREKAAATPQAAPTANFVKPADIALADDATQALNTFKPGDTVVAKGLKDVSGTELAATTDYKVLGALRDNPAETALVSKAADGTEVVHIVRTVDLNKVPKTPNAPPPPALKIDWVKGERIQGHVLTTTDGRALSAACDYEIVDIANDARPRASLKITNGPDAGTFIEVPLAELKKIKKTPKPLPAPSSGTSTVAAP